MKQDNNFLKLKSGKEIYAHKGIIGLGKKLNIFEGYDGCIGVDESYKGGYTSRHALTQSQAKEVCEIMIKRWSKLLKKVETRIEKENIKQK